MPTLPGVLAPVRAAVASVLRSSDHAGNLYSADDVALALNVAVDAAAGALVDVPMILRAFANEAEDEFILKYDEYFHCHGDGHVLYVRHEANPGRHEGKKSFFLLADSAQWNRHGSSPPSGFTLEWTTVSGRDWSAF